MSGGGGSKQELVFKLIQQRGREREREGGERNRVSERETVRECRQ